MTTYYTIRFRLFLIKRWLIESQHLSHMKLIGAKYALLNLCCELKQLMRGGFVLAVLLVPALAVFSAVLALIGQ